MMIITVVFQVGEYFDLRMLLSKLHEQMRQTMLKPVHILPFLNPGRLVKVRDGAEDWGWGIVVNFKKQNIAGNKAASVLTDANTTIYVVDVILEVGWASLCWRNGSVVLSLDKQVVAPAAGERRDKNEKLKPAGGSAGQWEVVPVLLHTLEKISKVRVHFIRDLKDKANLVAAGESVCWMLNVGLVSRAERGIW